MSDNDADRAVREIAACPTDLPGTARERAPRADRDALKLARHLRQFDNRQAWGRLNLWLQEQPDHLMAVTISALAMVDPHDTTRLDWTRNIGGTAGLHPDYEKNAPTESGAAPDRDQRILDLYHSGLERTEVAYRVGVSQAVVQRVVQQDRQERAA